jgi:hypothetical protein
VVSRLLPANPCQIGQHNGITEDLAECGPSKKNEESMTAPQSPPDDNSTIPPMPESGWRILGFGKHPEIAAAMQAKLRSLGLRATNIALTNNAAGDARLVQELQGDDYDGVAIGSFISGQDPAQVPTEETTLWFERVLNLIHAHAPRTKIILVRNPTDGPAAIERVLGPTPH